MQQQPVQSTAREAQDEILQLLVEDMPSQYKTAKQLLQSPSSNTLKSLDYTQYIPYEYGTLDRMALLLTGSDVCTAVYAPPTGPLIVTCNEGVEEAELQRKKQLLTVFRQMAKDKRQKPCHRKSIAITYRKLQSTHQSKLSWRINGL